MAALSSNSREELTQAESPQPPPIATPGQTLLPRDEDAQ